MMDNEMGNKGSNSSTPKMYCRCLHHFAWPLIVIAFGVIMLLSVLGILGSGGAGVAISVIVIILGISMIMNRICRCC